MAWWTSFAQNGAAYLTKNEIEKDLAFFNEVLLKNSSYQGLNGYNYQKDLADFLAKTNHKSISKYDFGLFLSKTIGKIGDRHANVRGYELRDSVYFPFSFAPFKDKILVLDYDAGKKEYTFWNSEFPYLKSIDNIPIQQILPAILPEEILAPKYSYFTRSVRVLRDIELVFRTLQKELPNPLSITLTNEKGMDKVVSVALVKVNKRGRYWDEQFYKNTYKLSAEKYNDNAFIERFFKLENNIGYIQIADMIAREESPNFFQMLNKFMTKASQSDALIIDVRDNGGGTRELTQELAGYFIHPDSVYVVNATRQRGVLPLNEELEDALHNRFLFARAGLDAREKTAVDKFMASFKPMYKLDDKKFSEYHYYILNGQKIAKDKYHYNKPIYILANERSFSAASIFVSVFKGLPNVKVVGVNTDGSSGNSERKELPNSKLSLKISTMVSFQKDGKILDGIGTAPDILLERNLDQILFKEDFQLKELLEIIKHKKTAP